MMLLKQSNHYPLCAKDDSKLSQILSQQRLYQQQVHQQQVHQKPANNRHDVHSHRNDVQSDHSPPSSPGAGCSQNNLQDADEDSSDKTSLTSELHTVDKAARTVWANPVDSSVLSHVKKQITHTNDLMLQDVSSEYDARSSISLLESDSVYLPFDSPASPLPAHRPFTAPEKLTEQPLRKPVPPSVSQFPDTHLPRPFTAADARHRMFTKHDPADQRPIRPSKQNFKPLFDVARPLTSSSEPSVRTHKDAAPPTALSQDYESSSEQTASESETISSKSDGPSSQAAPKDKLSHIKSIAGSKKAGIQPNGYNIQEKSLAAQRLRKPPTSNHVSASSLATKALKQHSALKLNTAKEGFKPHSPATGNRNNSQTLDRSRKEEPSIMGSPSGYDSKQVKGQLNLHRMELKKDVRTHEKLQLENKAYTGTTEGSHFRETKAAVCIQSYWRGYWAREHNANVMSIRKEIRARRAEDHIMLLRKDLERNQKLYEEEKRLRILQMEAIKLLYHEVQVLKSHSMTSSKELSSTDGCSNTSSNANTFSPMTTAASSVSAPAPSGYSELNRTHELERTCLSLQAQVSQLQEALLSVSSAVFKPNSLDGASFDLTDHSDAVQVTSYVNNDLHRQRHSSDDSCHWGCIPHSLSPYISEEEESYYLRVPTPGAPTPPRCLQMQHHSPTALWLTWQASTCIGRSWEEEEGNKHIIGYRIYVNDKLKAFISHSTSALVEGLNPSTTYKLYVKALSGLGESYESNILMAKLAIGPERLKDNVSSGTDMSHDSDKDLDSTEPKLTKHRKIRKSPRSEKKSVSKSYRQRNPPDMSGASLNLNSNNSEADAIFTHPKLYKHRKQRSKDLHHEDHSTTSFKETSPTPGTEERKSPNSAKREALKKLHQPVSFEIPKKNEGESSELKQANKKDSPRNKESPASGSSKPESPAHIKRKEEATRASPGGSPSCGSEGENTLKCEPKLESDTAALKLSPSAGRSQSSSMSGTFTVDKANSFLESLNAITVSALANSNLGSPTSGSRGHRRTRSRDYQTTEKAAEVSTEVDLMTEESRKLGKDKVEGSDGSTGEDLLSKIRSHRRKRSKELAAQVSEWRKEEMLGEAGEEKLDSVAESQANRHEEDAGHLPDPVHLSNRPVIDGRHRHSSGSRPNSPVVAVVAGEDKHRLTVAEQMLNKLRESARSEESSKLDVNRRSSSIESISSATRGDTSRRSPSVDSLPESIKEDSEANPEGKQGNLPSGIRLGHSRDTGRGGSADSVQTRSARETNSMVTKLLLKLESITQQKNPPSKKEQLVTKKSNPDERDHDTGSKPPSDDERKTGRRSRNLSESDAEGGPQLPPRAPSESSSGSHSDDSRQSRRTHRRTPSDHWSAPSVECDPTRPTHSPIIMEGNSKKSGSSVRRNQSFHGILPSKHQDTKTTPPSNEESSSKTEEQVPYDVPVRSKSHLRSRTPSPVGSRTPVLSAAQLKKQSDSGKSLTNHASKS